MAKIIYKHHWFWKHEVMVKVPIHKPAIKPKRLEIPEGIPLPKVGPFRPLRLVINLKMVKVAHSTKLVTKFTPHIIIRVRYYQKDLDDANKAGGSLALGYWDGVSWQRFSDANHFQTDWDDKKKKGWATVEISGWEDPIIAVGT